MKVAIVVFPGTNCEHDVMHVCSRLLGYRAFTVWHSDVDLKKPDVVVLPGGFAYGDYLRTGALAKVSPVMNEVRAFAERGGPVLGICNGFQILCESGLLPGALMINAGTKFLSQFAGVRCERTDTPFTSLAKPGEIYRWPLAHGEGNYFCETQTLERLEGEGQVIYRYCSLDGVVDHQSRTANPNGSVHSIAGICNERRNVMGLMPHPERAAESRVGSIGAATGLSVFESLAGL